MWLAGLARNAVVVIAGIVLAYWLSVYGHTPFKITGNITEGLPPFGLPPFSTSHDNVTYTFQDMLKIYGSSVISVPLIALLESIAIAKAFGKSGFRLNYCRSIASCTSCNCRWVVNEWQNFLSNTDDKALVDNTGKRSISLS